jgi:hypothetical protein
MKCKCNEPECQNSLSIRYGGGRYGLKTVFISIDSVVDGDLGIYLNTQDAEEIIKRLKELIKGGDALK